MVIYENVGVRHWRCGEPLYSNRPTGRGRERRGRAASFRVLVLSMAWREGKQATERSLLPYDRRCRLSAVASGGERPASVCAINMVANLVARLRDVASYLTTLLINFVEHSLHRHSPNITSNPPSMVLREGERDCNVAKWLWLWRRRHPSILRPSVRPPMCAELDQCVSPPGQSLCSGVPK